MTDTEIIRILENNKQCSQRIKKGTCNKDCFNCYYHESNEDFIEALGYAINDLKNLKKVRDWWNKQK